MGGFSRYLDPGGERRDARPAPMSAFDEPPASAPRTGYYINERAFAAALPPVDDNLLPRKRPSGVR